MIALFEHPWYHGLFGDAEGAAIWAPKAQMAHFVAFERALARALEATGQVPAGQGTAAAAALKGFQPDEAAIADATTRDGLPVPELVRQMRACAGPAATAVHTGATSQDVLDTALALSLQRLSDLTLARLQRLDTALHTLVAQFGTASVMGRTRMQAALPISGADRIESWRQPLIVHTRRLQTLRDRVEVLQLGGPVGTRAELGPRAEEITARVARELGLHVAPHVWHSDRSGLVAYAGLLAGISGSLGKMGQDICLMAQQGINEIALAGGGGSSAMPHKSNPVLAELLVTLARFNAVQIGGMHQAMVHEQERSGAAWGLEWMTLPPMAMATGRALAAAEELCQRVTRIGSA